MKDDYNYLKSTQSLLNKGKFDYCTSSNYDENLAKYFPSLCSEDVFNLSAHYPCLGEQKLERLIKNKLKLQKIAMGAGSEDLIVRICQIIKNNNWKTGVVVPTFYRIIDNLADYTVIPNKNFNIIDYRIFDIVWIVNPNPLTGKYTPKALIKLILKKNPRTMFVVDETEIFFLENWSKASLLNNCSECSNLLVITSFSKFHNVPGLRVGFAAGNKSFVLKLISRGPTFPISNLSRYITEKVITNIPFKKVRAEINKNKEEVERLLLSNSNIEIRHSDINCVFCRLKNRKNFYKKLLEIGIIGLNLDTQVGADKMGWVRLTIHSSPIKHKNLVGRLKKLNNYI